MSAATLHVTAHYLGVATADFFFGLVPLSGVQQKPSPELAELIELFHGLRSGDDRRRVLAMVRAGVKGS